MKDKVREIKRCESVIEVFKNIMGTKSRKKLRKKYLSNSWIPKFNNDTDGNGKYIILRRTDYGITGYFNGTCEHSVSHWLGYATLYDSPPIEEAKKFKGFIAKVGKKSCPVKIEIKNNVGWIIKK